MIRRPPRSTPLYSSAASDVYKRQMSDDDLASVFAPELIYTAPDGQVVVGKRAVAAKLREHTPIEAHHLLETPTMLPSNTVVLDTHTTGGARHLVVMKRRAADGLVSSITEEEGHRKALAPPLAARAMKTSVQSPTDMMMSPCTCLLYTSPSPRDRQKSRMPSSA